MEDYENCRERYRKGQQSEAAINITARFDERASGYLETTRPYLPRSLTTYGLREDSRAASLRFNEYTAYLGQRRSYGGHRRK